MALAPSRSPFATIVTHTRLLMSVGSQRKREGTEALVISAAKEQGIGIGETLAGLASLRSVASVVGPLVFGAAYTWGTHDKTQRYLPGTPFVCSAALAVTAEVVFRSLLSTRLIADNCHQPAAVQESELSETIEMGEKMKSTTSRDVTSFLTKTRQTVNLVEKIILSQDTRLFRFSLGSPSMKLGLPIGKHIKFWCSNPAGVDEGMWNGRPGE